MNNIIFIIIIITIIPTIIATIIIIIIVVVVVVVIITFFIIQFILPSSFVICQSLALRSIPRNQPGGNCHMIGKVGRRKRGDKFKNTWRHTKTTKQGLTTSKSRRMAFQDPLRTWYEQSEEAMLVLNLVPSTISSFAACKTCTHQISSNSGSPLLC
jgi:hypothetical protein